MQFVQLQTHSLVILFLLALFWLLLLNIHEFWEETLCYCRVCRSRSDYFCDLLLDCACNLSFIKIRLVQFPINVFLSFINCDLIFPCYFLLLLRSNGMHFLFKMSKRLFLIHNVSALPSEQFDWIDQRIELVLLSFHWIVYMLYSLLQSFEVLHMLFLCIGCPFLPIGIRMDLLIVRFLIIINPLVWAFFNRMYTFLELPKLLILRTFELVL